MAHRLPSHHHTHTHTHTAHKVSQSASTQCATIQPPSACIVCGVATVARLQPVLMRPTTSYLSKLEGGGGGGIGGTAGGARDQWGVTGLY